jgi:hypothetical protein
MENLKNFGDGSQKAGNDTADIGEHIDGGLGPMSQNSSKNRTFFFGARSSFFWKYWWAVSSAPAMA